MKLYQANKKQNTDVIKQPIISEKNKIIIINYYFIQ